MGPVQQNIMYDLKNVTFFWDINISLSPLTVFFLFLGSGIYFSNTLNLSKWGEEGFIFSFYIWNALKSIAITVAHLNKLSLSNKLTLNPQILAWMIPTSTQVICAISLVNDWNLELYLGPLINLAIIFQLKSVRAPACSCSSIIIWFQKSCSLTHLWWFCPYMTVKGWRRAVLCSISVQRQHTPDWASLFRLLFHLKCDFFNKYLSVWLIGSSLRCWLRLLCGIKQITLIISSMSVIILIFRVQNGLFASCLK